MIVDTLYWLTEIRLSHQDIGWTLKGLHDLWECSRNLYQFISYTHGIKSSTLFETKSRTKFQSSEHTPNHQRSLANLNWNLDMWQLYSVMRLTLHPNPCTNQCKIADTWTHQTMRLIANILSMIPYQSCDMQLRSLRHLDISFIDIYKWNCH